MGDLDFEELDKAVNNLMSKTGAVKGYEPESTTLSLNSTLQPGEGPNHGMVQAVVNGIGGDISDAQRTVMQDLQSTPKFDASTSQPESPVAFTGPVAPDSTAFAPVPIPAPPSIVSPVSTDQDTPVPMVVAPPAETPTVVPVPIEPPRPVAPRPSSGRFMDVVHPSSDMKLSSGPALVVPPRPELSTPQPSMAPAFDSQPSVPQTSPVEEPVSVADSAPELSPVTEDTQPLTPFLPDANAKVEKRPLGATPDTDKAIDAPAIPEISATPDVPIASSFPEIKPAEADDLDFEDAQPINGEFDHSVSKSEKGESQRPIDPTSVIVPESKQEKELQSIESVEVAGADIKQDDVRAVESGDTGHLSSGKSVNTLGTAESSEDKTGDVFDVKNNHHPAIQPIKQRSGWLTIIIVVFVIIVCIGIAAAAYYMLGLGV